MNVKVLQKLQNKIIKLLDIVLKSIDLIIITVMLNG